VVKRTQILHSKLPLESSSSALQKIQVQGDEDDVIDIQWQVHNVGAAMVDEQGVYPGLHKDQVRGEAVVPNLGRLLQAVERLVEPAHQVGVSRIN
jgi:hypothetical protein